MTVKAPQGMIIPDGVQEGDTFKAMTTWRLQKGTMLQLCAIQDEEVDKPKKGFVQSYSDTMKGNQ